MTTHREKITETSDLGDLLVEGAQEMLAHVRGEKTHAREHVVMVDVPEQIDVVAIRKRLDMSRHVFACRFGFSVRTLAKWERGERQPEGPARAYLTVIAREPKAVERALTGRSTGASPDRRGDIEPNR
jgi:putative transcriptional regulator